MKTPANNFKSFCEKYIKGKEVISPTLLQIKLDFLVHQEKEQLRNAYYAGRRNTIPENTEDFEKWYENFK